MTLSFGDDALETLPQFAVGLRITKRLPPEPSTSWFGGCPRLPVDEPWPTDPAGRPLVFVAQLCCSDFPDELWGGTGPRSGWLAVFVGGTGGEGRFGESVEAQVIHVASLGPEREPPEAAIDWLRPADVDLLTPQERRLPRWPVSFYPHPEGADDRAEPFRRGSDGDRPSPWDGRWPGGDAGHPLTARGVGHLFDGLQRWLAQELEVVRGTASQLRAMLDASPTSDDDLRRFRRDVAERRLPELEDAITTISQAQQQVIALVPANVPARPSEAEWRALHDRLNAIERVDVVRQIQDYAPNVLGERYFERRFSFPRPRRIPALRQALVDVVVDIGAVQKRLRIAAGNRRSRLSQYESKSRAQRAAMAEHEVFGLAHDRDTFDEAQRIARETKATMDRLIDLRERVAPMKGTGRVTDAIWAEVSAMVEGVVLTDFEWEVIRPGVPERADFEITRRNLLDPTGRASSSRFLDALVRYRRAVAPLIMSEEPETLPSAVRAHFEPLWDSAARDVHDGMGGLPRWDAVYPNLILGPQYYSPPDRERWLLDNPLMGFAAPPFDEDNAVLLQLFTCPLMGWSFGDSSHLVLLCPRSELAAGRTDRVLGFISG